MITSTSTAKTNQKPQYKVRFDDRIIKGFGIDSEGTANKVSVGSNGRIYSHKKSDYARVGAKRVIKSPNPNQPELDRSYRFIGTTKEAGMAIWEEKYRRSPVAGNFIVPLPSSETKKTSEKRRSLSPLQEASDIKVVLLTEEEVSFWFERIYSFALSSEEKVGLNDDDFLYLWERGFLDESIPSNKFFSCDRNIIQKIEREFQDKLPKGFPAWNFEEKKFTFYLNRAIACPATNTKGQITGIQFRHIGSSVTNRYTWWSSKLHSKNFNVEGIATSPLNFSAPQKKKKINEKDNWVLLCEGFLKSSLAAYMHGIRTIGAPGFQHASKSSAHLLLEYLRKAKQESPNPDCFKVILAPDAGATANPNVVAQMLRVVDLLEKHGYSVVVYWYGQRTKPLTFLEKKQGGDIDERTTRFSSKKLISVENFRRIIKSEEIQAGIDRRIEEETNILAYSRRENSDWKVREVNQRFISDAIAWNKMSGIVGIRSGMSTGKTEALKELVVENENSFPDPVKTTLLGSRNALLIQTSKRIGAKHIKQASGCEIGLSDVLTLSLCVDSLLRIRPQWYKADCLVLDEAESIIEHLLIGETCAEKRQLLIDNLRAICQKIIINGGKIVLLDAGLTARSVKFIEELIRPYGMQEPYEKHLIVNHYKGSDTTWDVTFINGSVKEIVSPKSKSSFTKHCKDDRSAYLDICQRAIQGGKNIYVTTDSKSEALALHTLLRQQGYEGLCITSKTMNEEAIKFLENPKLYLLRNPQIRYAIASPSVESGSSIEGNHFSLVVGVFSANTSTDKTQMQMLGRVRNPCPRAIFVPVKAKGSCNTAGLAEKDLFHWDKYFPQNLFKASLEASIRNEAFCNTQKHISRLQDPILREVAEFQLEAMRDRSKTLTENDYITQLTNELLAARNWNSSNSRRDLLEGLKKAGHRITIIDEENTKNDAALNILSSCREKNERKESKDIAAAEVISFKDAIALKQSGTLPPEQLHKVERAFLQEELPDVVLKEELVYEAKVHESGRWFHEIKAIAALQNVDALRSIEAAKLFYTSIRNTSQISLNDVPISAKKADDFCKLGIEELLIPSKVHSKEDLIGRLKFYKQHYKKFKHLQLGASKKRFLSEEDGLEFANKMLEKSGTGLELVKVGDGSYQISSEDSFADEQWRECLTAYEKHLDNKASDRNSQVEKTIENSNKKFST